MESGVQFVDRTGGHETVEEANPVRIISPTWNTASVEDLRVPYSVAKALSPGPQVSLKLPHACQMFWNSPVELSQSPGDFTAKAIAPTAVEPEQPAGLKNEKPFCSAEWTLRNPTGIFEVVMSHHNLFTLHRRLQEV
jgi:hypothetical protein